MDKATDLSRTSAVGSLHLFVGKTLSTVFLAAATLLMGALISPSDYGLYVIVLIPATTMLLFQDWGIASAMTKNCAQRRAENNQTNLREIILSGLTFEFATAIILTIILIATSGLIATSLFNKPQATYLITIASATIIATAITNAIQSVFIGFEKTKHYSVLLICQATTQGIISLILVYFGYGALGAVLGYTVGTVTTGILACVLLYLSVYRKLPKSNIDRNEIRQTLKPLLRYGVPLAIGTILLGSYTQINALLMASHVSTELIGNYKIATNFLLLLTFFSAPISTVLFPVFSKINPKKEKNLLQTVFASSANYAALITTPAGFALMVLSQPLVSTLYHNKYPFAPIFLALATISYLAPLFWKLGYQLSSQV